MDFKFQIVKFKLLFQKLGKTAQKVKSAWCGAPKVVQSYNYNILEDLCVLAVRSSDRRMCHKVPCSFKEIYKPVDKATALKFILIKVCYYRVAQPLFLKYTISSFSDGSETWKQYAYATGVCLTALLHTLILQPSMFSIQHVGMKCRVAVCSLIYRKVKIISKYLISSSSKFNFCYVYTVAETEQICPRENNCRSNGEFTIK